MDPPPVKQEAPTIQSITEKWVNATDLPKAGPELLKGRKVLLVSVEQRVPQPMKTVVQDGGGNNGIYATNAEEVGLVVVARATNETPRITEARVRLFDRTWQIDAIAVPEGKVAASWTRKTLAADVTLAPTPRTMNNQRIAGQDVYGRFPRAELDADCAAIQAGNMPGMQLDASAP